MALYRKVTTRTRGGFTLLELIGVVLVISILATISLPVYNNIRGRAETLSCAANLRTLYSGASAYVQEHQYWPKIVLPKPGPLSGGTPDQPNSFESKWIEALKPYGVNKMTWRCPSIEREIRANGKEGAADHVRIDYTPTMFESGPLAPYQWPSHPWFIERGASHGKGPQIMLTNGSIVTVEEFMRGGGK